MIDYKPGSAEVAAKEMVVFSQQVRKIMEKANKLEAKYEKAISSGYYLKAARIRRGYMNLAKKYPKLVK